MLKIIKYIIVISVIAIILIISIFSKKHKLKSILLSVVLGLTFITASFYFLNNCLSFSTSESAFCFVDGYNPDLVINGNECDLIIGSKNNKNRVDIIDKVNGKWKYYNGFTAQQIKSMLICDNKYSVMIYKSMRTWDFFISVTNVNAHEQFTVTDLYGSKFLEYNNSESKSYRTYFAHLIDDYDYFHYLIINGEQIKVK